MMDETGFWENATVGLLVCAVALCVALVLRRGRLPRWMIVYVALVALVAVYFAGEEASWGQHWFGYRTPEPVARANRQREFNLHNLGGTYRSAFNRLPRKLAIWGMLIGGVILPVVLIPWRRRPGRNLGPADWLIPTWRLVPAAALFSLSTAPEHLLKDYLPQLRRSAYLEMAFVTPSEEFKEFMLAAGILLYVVSIFARSRAAAQPPQA